MLEIYFNTTSREAFDADGNQFRSGMPRLAYMSRDTVRVILCSETPENDNAGVDPTTWTRDTSYNVAGVGAMLTVDSDYIHKLKGDLSAEVTAGSVSSVTATIASASYAKIPSSGVLRLFDAYGNYEALSYTARSIDGTSVTFTTSGTLTGTYATGATMDCDQSPYCSSMLDTAASNVEQGEFVFQLVVNSDRLREEMDYTDTEKLSVKGLEILLYKTTGGSDEPLNAFVCDTFSIVGTIGAVGFESDPPDGTENKLAGVVDQLLAAGFEVEQQYDSAGNTQFRFRSVEAGGTWSSWVTVNKGQDGDGTGDMTEAVYDTNGDGKVDAADTADSVGSTTAAQVADAVSKAHEHSNKTTLDKFAEQDGSLTFNGQPVGGGTGNGTVTSVNGVGPDESGNVALTARADLEFTSASLSANVLTVSNATIAGLVVLDAEGMQQLPEITQSGTSVLIDFTGWTINGTWRVQFSNVLAASDAPDYYTKAEIDAKFGTFEAAATAVIGEEA